MSSGTRSVPTLYVVQSNGGGVVYSVGCVARLKRKPCLPPGQCRASRSWVDYVNAPQTEAELFALRRSVNRGSPFGDERWCERTIDRLSLGSTIRPIGRPKKSNNGS